MKNNSIRLTLTLLLETFLLASLSIVTYNVLSELARWNQSSVIELQSLHPADVQPLLAAATPTALPDPEIKQALESYLNATACNPDAPALWCDKIAGVVNGEHVLAVSTTLTPQDHEQLESMINVIANFAYEGHDERFGFNCLIIYSAVDNHPLVRRERDNPNIDYY